MLIMQLSLISFHPVCVFVQSKLNCEVLHDDLAFEVRWAVAGESIVIQLVAKLGKYASRSSQLIVSCRLFMSCQ